MRSIEHFLYESVVTSPSGKSIRLQAHQNFEFQDEVVTLTGQGAIIRAPVRVSSIRTSAGSSPMSACRFPGVTLFASAKSVSFVVGDPDAVSAAICAAIG